MCQKRLLILCVSLFALISCTRVNSTAPRTCTIELLRIEDITKNPYAFDLLKRNLYELLSIKEGTEGKYLLEVYLNKLSEMAGATDSKGFQAYNIITLSARFNIYERGRVEPMISRAITLRDSYYVSPNPNVALSKKIAAIRRLTQKLCEEIRLSFYSYFWEGGGYGK